MDIKQYPLIWEKYDTKEISGQTLEEFLSSLIFKGYRIVSTIGLKYSGGSLYTSTDLEVALIICEK
jgi:hypothetical protein